VQPDVARSGLTEACRIADMVWELGKPLVPHVGFASAPAIAAAVHLAASARQCSLIEYTPAAVDFANRFLTRPIEIRDAAYVVPQAPGLGIEWREFPPRIGAQTA
jgi:L-alanine-DL-glutamate epimerase-like enolase superfamily enzyme